MQLRVALPFAVTPARGRRHARTAGSSSSDSAGASSDSFNPDDPLTWRRNTVEAADEYGEPDQTLDTDQLEQLLSGASVPIVQPDKSTGSWPQSATEAIERAIKALEQDDAESAETLLLEALTLPGTGPTRVRGKPAELSEGELQAAHFNLACARARLGSLDDAMDSLEEAVQNGYENIKQMQSDADLQQLQDNSERFNQLVESLQTRKRSSLPFGLDKLFE